MREHGRNDDNLFEDLYRTKRYNEDEFRDLWNRMPGAPILRVATQVPSEPFEGQFAIDPTNPLSPGWCFFRNGEWWCIYPRDPVHAIKVYGDNKANATGNGAFKFNVEKDLDNHQVSFVEAANGIVGTGATTVQISNQTKGIDILSTPLTIAGSAFHDNGTAVVNETLLAGEPRNVVHWKDRIWIDVDAVGAGSKGLHVYMTFTPYDEDALP